MAGQNTVSIAIDVSPLNDLVKRLGDDIEGVIRTAAQAGAQVIYDRARMNVSMLHKSGVGTGNLYNSIYQKFAEDLSEAGKRAVYKVSWRTTKGSGLPRAPHGHLLEFGWIQKYARFQDPRTGEWKTTKKRLTPADRQQQPATRFMSRAIYEGEAQAVLAMEDALIQHLIKITNEP